MLDRHVFAPIGQIESRGERPLVLKAVSLAASGKPSGGEKMRGQVTHQQHGVLVIDGSLTVRTIVKTCLRRAGFLVFDFPDGIQALRWLDSPQASLPDLILLDTDVINAGEQTRVSHSADGGLHRPFLTMKKPCFFFDQEHKQG